jgi:hypothetical protein
LSLVPEEPGLADVTAEQRELLSRLRAVVEAKDAGNQVLRAELDAARERERRLELRLAELERRLRMEGPPAVLARTVRSRSGHSLMTWAVPRSADSRPASLSICSATPGRPVTPWLMVALA